MARRPPGDRRTPADAEPFRLKKGKLPSTAATFVVLALSVLGYAPDLVFYGWFWAAFVFLFGLPGYVGYRLHKSWPWSQPVPAPEFTGREVFAN